MHCLHYLDLFGEVSSVIDCVLIGPIGHCELKKDYKVA